MGWGGWLLVRGWWLSLSSLMAASTWEAKLLLWPPLAGVWRQLTLTCGEEERWFHNSMLLSDTMFSKIVENLVAKDSHNPHEILPYLA